MVAEAFAQLLAFAFESRYAIGVVVFSLLAGLLHATYAWYGWLPPVERLK